MTALHLHPAMLVLICASALGTPAAAYDIPIHRSITEKAVAASGFDDVLRHVLNIPEGAGAIFSDGMESRSARDWVREGAGREDKPDSRVLNHFHNPMAATWAEAGLRATVTLFGQEIGIRGESSVLWQQNPRQDTGFGGAGGIWSWPIARQSYYEALTGAQKTTREIAFAKTFRALGQVMHLLQDASLPAHTRNDPHLYIEFLNVDLGDPDGYERWVDKKRTDLPVVQSLAAPPQRPSDRIFAIPRAAARIDRDRARAPIARLIDTGQYVGSNPEILVGDLIGLSEYSNGNFFSNDTISLKNADILQRLPYPAPGSVSLRTFEEEAPGTGGQMRRYFQKSDHGDWVDYLAVPGALYLSLPEALRDRNIKLDPKVYANYAAKLLPRAVGYSAALLDYFFRGKLETRVESRLASDGLRIFLRTFIQIANQSDRETMDGRFELYYDRGDGSRAPLPGWALTQSLGPGATSDVIELPPFPGDLSPATPLLLVFRGRLGEGPDAEEPEAVVAAPVGPGAYRLFLASSIDPNSEYGELSFLDPSLFTTPSGYQFSLIASASAGVVVGLRSGTGSSAANSYFYRSFGVAPGNSATVLAGGSCSTHVFAPFEPTHATQGPVSAEVVGLREPSDLETLYGYTGFNPPALERVLHGFTASPEPGGFHTASIDITGMRFLGLRLTSQPQPPAPPPPPPGFTSSAHATCHAGVSITIPR